nr:seroin 1 [Yponomeuta cagnagella]
MASRGITFVAIMLFGAAYAPHASAFGPNGYANTNDCLGLPTPPPLFLPNGQPFPQQNIQPQVPLNGNGVSMTSSSSSTGGGGSIITISHNGETQTFTVGDNPPRVYQTSGTTQPREPTPPKKPTPPKMLNLNFPKFEPITFKPIPMPKMIDPEEMKSYKPNNGENFIGTSSSSHTTTHIVNGKRVTTGGINTMSNVNGVVSERSIVLNDNGEEED